MITDLSRRRRCRRRVYTSKRHSRSCANSSQLTHDDAQHNRSCRRAIFVLVAAVAAIAGFVLRRET